MVQPSLPRVRHLAKAKPRALRHGVRRGHGEEPIRTGFAGPHHPQRSQRAASRYLKVPGIAP
jgi:hypothetical protein